MDEMAICVKAGQILPQVHFAGDYL